MLYPRHVVPALVALFTLAGCASLKGDDKPTVALVEMRPTTAAAAVQLNPVGLVRFTQLGKSNVLVEAEIKGLKPNSENGFHVHVTPDCSGDGMKTGGHFNPDANPHSHPGLTLRHAGAMFNLKANADGVGTLRQEVDTITLTPGKYSVVGLPLIIHRDPDDYVSQPLGNAGPRIACGIITLQTPPPAK